MNRRPALFTVSALALLLAMFVPAFGQATGTPSDEEVKARLAFIQTALDAGRGRAGTWWYGWLGGYAAATVVQGGLAIAKAKDIRPVSDAASDDVNGDRKFAADMLVGGATTALGIVGMLIDPFTPLSAPGGLRALPDGTPEERLAKLQRAEELLRRCARREREGKGLATHLLNLGVNAAAGVVTAAAFKRPWTDGLVNFGIGEAVSLLNIFTQPCRAVRDLKTYETSFPSVKGEPPPAGPETTLTVGCFPGGLRLSLAW
jgi:hypothetical protein